MVHGLELLPQFHEKTMRDRKKSENGGRRAAQEGRSGAMGSPKGGGFKPSSLLCSSLFQKEGGLKTFADTGDVGEEGLKPN